MVKPEDNEKRSTWLCKLLGHKFSKGIDFVRERNSCWRCGFNRNL